MKPEHIPAMHEAATKLAKIFKVPVTYSEPQPPPYPAGIFLVGDPEQKKPLGADGAMALSKALTEMGMRADTQDVMGNAFDRVLFYGVPFDTPEKMEQALATLVGRQDGLRKALGEFDPEKESFRVQYRTLKSGSDQIYVDPKAPAGEQVNPTNPNPRPPRSGDDEPPRRG